MRSRLPSSRHQVARTPHAPMWWLPLIALLLASATACGRGAATKSLTSTDAATPSPVATATPVPCDAATQWKPPAGNIALNSLSMVSAVEGWATAVLNPGPIEAIGPSGAILYHLVNGQWQRLPQIYPGAGLVALSMDSPTDGWAASPQPIDGSQHPLVLHYTGGAWQPVDVPALDAVLRPTATISGAIIMTLTLQMFGPDAGWMFAWTNRDADNEGGPRSLVLRYEAGQWRLIPDPPIAASVTLFDLSAVSADESWMVGTDYASPGQTTLFFHYLNGGWTRSPETFPFVTESVTMLSAADGWAGYHGGRDELLHYDGVRWAPFPTPPALAKQGLVPLGVVFAMAPGVDWHVTATPDPSAQGPVSLWQDADGNWSQEAWPYLDSSPDTLASGSVGEVWGIANIEHQYGCPPGLETFLAQGVFLHQVNGQWSRQVLPYAPPAR